MLPRFVHVRGFKVVHRKLLFFRQPHFPVFRLLPFSIARPHNVVHAVNILKKRGDPFQSIRQLSGNRIQIHAPALLEISELRDLQAVEHHLPANAPRSQGWRLPVIFLELDVVLPQINAHRGQRLQIQVLHIFRRRLQNHLQLRMLVQPVGIFAVTPVCRAP